MDKYERRRLALLEILKSRCGGKAAELAKQLSISDSYASRMLYPEGKGGRKRIGEDMVDRIIAAFDLKAGAMDDLGADGSALESVSTKATETPADTGRDQPQYAWISSEESMLISLYRTTDEEGREDIMSTAKESPRVVLPGIAWNKA